MNCEYLETENYDFLFIFILKNRQFILKKTFPGVMAPMSFISCNDVSKNNT